MYTTSMHLYAKAAAAISWHFSYLWAQDLEYILWKFMIKGKLKQIDQEKHSPSKF